MKSEYEKIKDRERHCVCRQCGSRLEAQLVTYNRFGGRGIELVCPRCQRIEYGTEPEIFELSKRFVDQVEFNYFMDMAEDERSERLNIAKVGEIITWLFREMGICTFNGMTGEGKKLEYFQSMKTDGSSENP